MNNDSSGAVHGGIRLLLRIEGALVLALSSWLYAEHGAGWGIFALCFLVPDVTLLGYLAGPRVGAFIYNAGHSLAGPLLLLAVGMAGAAPVAISAGLIWIAHVGFDRMLGFGLKYPTGFSDTHLGRLGGNRKAGSPAS